MGITIISASTGPPRGYKYVGETIKLLV